MTAPKELETVAQHDDSTTDYHSYHISQVIQVPKRRPSEVQHRMQHSTYVEMRTLDNKLQLFA